MTIAAWKETTEELLAWASLADFTARLYLTEPSTENCSACRKWGELLADILPDENLPELLTRVNPEQADDLRQEFFDLFLVPMSGVYTPPFENAHRYGSMANGLSQIIGELYQAAGFYPETLDIPFYLKQMGRNDHLGLELVFFANLLYSADKASSQSEAERLRDTASQFFQEYPGQWAGSYGRELMEKARSPYFSALGALTVFVSKYAIDDQSWE
ncbi:hypothetical protein GF1_03960 [Desulfolithobacter dissulfuricans]|uniref:Uncharacterized protein n=1 Tax=Desulfolithobacter dissulfuricans TaxID=2795293 RepID=A0A915XHG7_9BACT|nr:molecular chaperone TorD family protein [Desulfolithobacter dissulfuricans]BCO08020.1 hypothetical protein GF1_03960 [Desulfolithobacter dissulfuricans]